MAKNMEVYSFTIVPFPIFIKDDKPECQLCSVLIFLLCILVSENLLILVDV